jgi:hypothetical protein
LELDVLPKESDLALERHCRFQRADSHNERLRKKRKTKAPDAQHGPGMNSMVYTTRLVENDGTLGEDSNHDGDGTKITSRQRQGPPAPTTSTTRPRRVMGLALMQARLAKAKNTCPMGMKFAHPTPPQASTAVPKNHRHPQQQQQPLET